MNIDIMRMVYAYGKIFLRGHGYVDIFIVVLFFLKVIQYCLVVIK